MYIMYNVYVSQYLCYNMNIEYTYTMYIRRNTLQECTVYTPNSYNKSHSNVWNVW